MATYIYDGFTKKYRDENGGLHRVTIKSDNDDSDGSDPRQWDNVGTMVCWHRRYRLGDKHDYRNPQDFIDDIKDRFGSDYEMLPIFMYEHGGITISTSCSGYPYNDRWDAGQVGFIYVSKEKALAEFAIDDEPWRERAKRCMFEEVKEYDFFLRGDVYGWILEKYDEEDDTWIEEESCWGFIGDTIEYTGILDDVPSSLVEVEDE